ncbi:MAG: acyl-CoA dehydrogenase family protein [Pseudomonadota bacterium]
MAEPDELIVDTTTRIFEDLGDPQSINNMDDDSWREPLWAALEEIGLTRTWVPEALGGAGATMRDGFEVLRIAGQYAVAVPLGETLLGGWLLSKAGLETPLGALSVAPVNRADDVRIDGKILSGVANRVPFAREAEHLAVLANGQSGPEVALVATKDVTIAASENLARDPTDRVTFEGVTALNASPSTVDQQQLQWMGATVRAMQMAGALQALLDMSVNYATERVAFGRPIGKFQAVQHNLAQLAGEASAANAAANSAAYAIDAAGEITDALFLDIASAKIRVGEAAGDGAMIAHQTHGAIGFTVEHILHRYSHRLWSWRDEFGDETAWSTELGYKMAAIGADKFWPTLTSV